MKLLIEIPDNYKQRLDEDFDNLNTGSIGCTSILMAVKEGTPIPDNAKNIDVLMTVFPKADIRFEGRNNELFGYIEFAGDWLEAPYRIDKDKDNELTIADNVRIGISTCHNFMTLVGYYKPTEHDKIYEKMMEITNDHDVSTDVADWCKLATVDGNNIVGDAYELPECTIYAIDHAKMNELNEKISKGW